MKKRLSSTPYWEAEVMLNGDVKKAIMSQHKMDDILVGDIEADLFVFNAPDHAVLMWAATGENIMHGGDGYCQVLSVKEINPSDSDSGFDDWKQNQ